MAATRLIAIHANQSRSTAKTLNDRLDYGMNPAKTMLKKQIDYGENPLKTHEKQLVSCYRCTKETASEEFALSIRNYERVTGKSSEGVIAYQIRQSFKPGEITEEECQKVGYETAMRFTKGKHAFIVCTHSDRKHLHNHIYFNAVNLDENKKWKNFWFSALALQKLSDQICMEHALSVIEKKTYSERESHLVHYQQTHSIRSQIRGELNIILAKQPQNLDELLKRLEGQGYEVKRGKHIAIKRRGQQRFIRLDSLGAGYTQKELQARIDGTYIPSKETKMNLLLDLKQKIRQGKGVGYQRWAEKYNVKQLAETLLFLQQNNIHSTTELQEKSKNSKSRCDSLLSDIKAREQRLKEIQELKNAIFSYSKTNDTWKAYKASSWNPRFREQHREEIEQHKNATNVFQNLPDKSIPKVKDLNSEYQSILSEKKLLYSAFRKEKENKNKWMIAEKNVEMLLSEEAVSEHKMTIR